MIHLIKQFMDTTNKQSIMAYLVVIRLDNQPVQYKKYFRTEYTGYPHSQDCHVFPVSTKIIDFMEAVLPP